MVNITTRSAISADEVYSVKLNASAFAFIKTNSLSKKAGEELSIYLGFF